MRGIILFFFLKQHIYSLLTTAHFKYTSASLQAAYTISFILPLYKGVPVNVF